MNIDEEYDHYVNEALKVKYIGIIIFSILMSIIINSIFFIGSLIGLLEEVKGDYMWLRYFLETYISCAISCFITEKIRIYKLKKKL